MEIQQPLILINRIHLWEEGFSRAYRPDNSTPELSRMGLDWEGSLRSCSGIWVYDVADTVALPNVSLGGAGRDPWHAVGNLIAENITWALLR